MKSYNDPLHNLIYNTDASHFENNEKTEIFLPKDKNEIIEIVQKAIDENKKIVCRAWWTNLVGNCLPNKDTIIIDISKINNVINQWYLIVEPWITWDALNEQLAKDNLYFPVLLGSHAAAQIWWMIATNWAWMRAIKYWKMDNWVTELEILTVTDDKQIKVDTYSRDDAKDFFWSEWNLWIVLSSKVKLVQKPESTSINFKDFDLLQDAIKYVDNIKNKKNSDLSALEIINPQVAEYVWLEGKYYVLVEYENSKDWEIKDDKEIKSIRDKRDACYAATVNAWYPQIEDPEIHENMDQIFNWFNENNIPVYGHIWIWVLHPHFKQWQEDLMDEMYNLVQKLWWNISWEHGIGKKKQKYLSKKQIDEIKKIKEKWDPNNIFWF